MYWSGLCVFSQETLENVKKCRNFLSTLIKLASSGKQSSETTASVKNLVKNLLVCFSAFCLWILLLHLSPTISVVMSVCPHFHACHCHSFSYFSNCDSSSVSVVRQEAKIEPEDFTSRLYQELNSSPQPYLVPFLKVSSVTHQRTSRDNAAW